MDQSTKCDHVIRPDLIRRTGGGWLAVAPKGAKLPIGVTALTAEEAQHRFCSAYQQWLSLLELEMT